MKVKIKDIKELLKNLDENKELRVVVSYSNEINEPRVELIKEIKPVGSEYYKLIL